MLITPEVARDLMKIIRDYHAAFAAAVFGRDAVTDGDWELAKSLGLIPDDTNWTSIFDDLHQLGAVLAHLDQMRADMSVADMKAHVRKHPVPRTKIEHHAAEWNKQHGAQYITALGDRAAKQVLDMAQAEDRKLEYKVRDLIRDITSARFGDEGAATRLKEHGLKEGLGDQFFEDEFRATIKRTTSNMGHATQDWTRDWQRIAQTEGHNAVNEGVKESWIEQEEAAAQEGSRTPRRILAYKLPRPDACQHCERLHLDGANPRLYWLDELQANGTNVGRRAADWRAVIGTTHPWCGCTLHRVPFMLTEKVTNSKGWRSGEAAPSVIGPGGSLVGI